MLEFIKKCLFTGLAFSLTLTDVNLLSCISMNNQECKVRLQIVNVNRDESVFFPFSIKIIKCSGSCSNISNPYAKLCVADVAKNFNVIVFNLMSTTNETMHIEWHETYKCKCRLAQAFLIVNNVGMMINTGVNAENQLIKAYVIKDIFGILVIVTVNVINHVMLVNIQTM